MSKSGLDSIKSELESINQDFERAEKEGLLSLTDFADLTPKEDFIVDQLRKSIINPAFNEEERKGLFLDAVDFFYSCITQQLLEIPPHQIAFDNHHMNCATGFYERLIGLGIIKSRIDAEAQARTASILKDGLEVTTKKVGVIFFDGSRLPHLLKVFDSPEVRSRVSWVPVTRVVYSAYDASSSSRAYFNFRSKIRKLEKTFTHVLRTKRILRALFLLAAVPKATKVALTSPAVIKAKDKMLCVAPGVFLAGVGSSSNIGLLLQKRITHIIYTSHLQKIRFPDAVRYVVYPVDYGTTKMVEDSRKSEKTTHNTVAMQYKMGGSSQSSDVPHQITHTLVLKEGSGASEPLHPGSIPNPGGISHPGTFPDHTGGPSFDPVYAMMPQSIHATRTPSQIGEVYASFFHGIHQVVKVVHQRKGCSLIDVHAGLPFGVAVCAALMFCELDDGKKGIVDFVKPIVKTLMKEGIIKNPQQALPSEELLHALTKAVFKERGWSRIDDGDGGKRSDSVPVPPSEEESPPRTPTPGHSQSEEVVDGDGGSVITSPLASLRALSQKLEGEKGHQHQGSSSPPASCGKFGQVLSDKPSTSHRLHKSVRQGSAFSSPGSPGSERSSSMHASVVSDILEEMREEQPDGVTIDAHGTLKHVYVASRKSKKGILREKGKRKTKSVSFLLE
ncbi:hypothetical protein ADUPG1_000481 [Aduncisulcus paluster]|uniref:Uncharacterized protein n=1 Tax=Aduncisulcus paluster TaxID=2918883 RepID=A0ABQ5K6J4_9EUKA|nr:hypothetical protein ADUPG1_000481 [Aduncisulcus paluster]